MSYKCLQRFKGSQKVHKDSQRNVNPLCEPCNKYKTLYINELYLVSYW